MPTFLSGAWGIISSICVNLIVAGLTAGLTAVWFNRRRLQIWLQSIVRYNKLIRVSAAYLFRIQVDGEYILMPGKHIEQYQPVGGVYKTFSSFDEKKSEWQIQAEPGQRFYEQSDLRIKIKGKYLGKFLSWFESEKNREVTVQREIIEELIETGILDYADLAQMEIEFLRRTKLPISHSVYFDADELHIFDIYELTLTAVTKQKILQAVGAGNLMKITENQIRKQNLVIDGKSFSIGAHTEYIL